MYSTETYVLLFGSALLAGIVNAIAGGGTLLTFPALLAVTSPVVANATSTVALIPGSIAGAWGLRRELRECRPWVSWLIPSSLVGGLIGSILVTQLPERIFELLIPWLILVASLLLVLQKPVSRWLGFGSAHETISNRRIVTVTFAQLAIGIYGGYFGAGIGILMLTALSFMGIPSIVQMNAVKNFLAALINGISVLVFIQQQRVDYHLAGVMMGGALLGGLLGAYLSRVLPAPLVRGIIITIGFSLTAYYFIKQSGGLGE